MSPSWRERLSVFVAEGDVRLQVLAAGWEPRVRHAVRAASLADALQGLQLLRAEVEVTLSDALVRYALVPEADALRSEAERQAAARHALVQTYGEVANGWEVAADRAGLPGGMLAAGIDAGLRAAIEAPLRAAGASSVSLQPALVRAINRAGVSRKAAGWIAVLEPRRIALAALSGGTLLALRNQRVRANASAELAVLLQQSRLVDGIPPEAAEVFLCGEEVPALADFQVVPLPADFSAWPRSARRSDPLQVAFGRQAPMLRGGDLAWLGVAAVVLGVAAWQYGAVASERAQLQAALADRFVQRQSSRPLDPSRPDAKVLAADVARANAVAARLQVPWEALFTDLEAAAGEGVTLLGFEPEGGMRRLRITGEARRFEDLTQYLRRLEAAPGLQNVFLAGHEQRDRGLNFTLTADWVRNDEPPRP